VPALNIHLLDVAIEVLDLHEFGVLVHRQHPERFLLLGSRTTGRPPVRSLCSPRIHLKVVVVPGGNKCRGCDRVGQRARFAYSFPS
jgi:hypothetical protein